jgi:hypothetical protein
MRAPRSRGRQRMIPLCGAGRTPNRGRQPPELCQPHTIARCEGSDKSARAATPFSSIMVRRRRWLAPKLGLVRPRALILVWGFGSRADQGQDCRARPFLCSSEERFFVPSTGVGTRRAQPRSSLTEGHRRRRRAAGLTAASAARGSPVRDEAGAAWGRRTRRGTGRHRNAAWPRHLVSGPGRDPGTLILHATTKARPTRDGTHLRKRGRAPG